MTLGNAEFKIVAAMAAALILTGAVMTGCGENSDSSATGTTAATTAAQTTANAAPGFIISCAEQCKQQRTEQQHRLTDLSVVRLRLSEQQLR